MLKFFPLLLILLPLYIGASDQVSPFKTDDSLLSVKSQTNRVQSVAALRTSDFLFSQCYQSVPPVVKDTNTLANEQLPVTIDARTLSGLPNQFIYKDNVSLTRGNKLLTADRLTYLIEEKKATAKGNVNFVSGELTLYSDAIETQLKTDQTTLYQANYQFHGRGGRGTAVRIYDNGLDLYEFNSSTYTACPPEDNTWTLNSSTLYIDNEEGTGSAYNAVLKIKGVPVFYFPYVSYPIRKIRKTGLLFPSFDLSNTNGFIMTQPLYLNLAENMDATFTPTYMEERGTLLATELRYLFNFGSGRLQAENLKNDRIREESRSLYHWDHNANFAGNWNIATNYSKVSDDFYFSDITTEYGSRTDNQLLQTAKLSYRQMNWNSELEVRDFQILGSGHTPHKVLPKLAFSAYQPIDWKSLQLDWYSEITQFEHADSNVYNGTRIHLEPKLSLPLLYNSFFVNTELKYMLSFYQQTIPESGKKQWYDELDKSVNRYIPSLKINSGINFERDFLLFDSQYKQTLVPQIQYLYVPYQDQGNIGIYDTTSMLLDYYGLFRDNRFSGYDRIADANQLTIGISSHFLNAQGEQRMRFAVGQNYYLTSSRTQLPEQETVSETVSRSSVIGEFDINFNDKYFYHAGLEWDSFKNIINKANTTLEKRWSHNTYAQLNYRYIAISEEDDEGNAVHQLGSKINWPINSQWTSFASYYYDLEYQHLFEQIIGLKYQSCCWAVGITYDKHMLYYKGSLDTLSEDYETEDNIGITFELMGLGSAGYDGGEQGVFDYGRPFYLQ